MIVLNIMDEFAKLDLYLNIEIVCLVILLISTILIGIIDIVEDDEN